MQENPYQSEVIESLPREARVRTSWQVRRMISAALLFTGSFGLAVTLGAFALGMVFPRFHLGAVACSLVMLTAGIWIRR